MPYTLTAIGCGTMGVAVLSGLIEHMANLPEDVSVEEKDALPHKLIATVKSAGSAEKLRKTFADLPDAGKEIQVKRSDENAATIKEADVVLLCCKPYLAEAILTADGISSALEGKLLVSVLAGATIAQLQGLVPKSCTVVRAMPNTPARVREGVVIVTPLEGDDEQTKKYNAYIKYLFEPSGLMKFLEEKHFDAVTALCGSGPAFNLLLIEAMADGAVMMGLPRADAIQLAAQTMQGTARMMLQTGSHPAVLKDAVTTPGGTTIAGLMSLEDSGVRGAMARCIRAAAEKATALGKK